ncbi:MAG: hypothetical protein HW386_840, partial [Gammaproteobacteria bacterium]|nr:hypothetical protein [Gammaproteobacteria bacterium]
VLYFNVSDGLMFGALVDAGDDAGAVFRITALILPVTGDGRRQRAGAGLLEAPQDQQLKTAIEHQWIGQPG